MDTLLRQFIVDSPNVCSTRSRLGHESLDASLCLWLALLVFATFALKSTVLVTCLTAYQDEKEQPVSVRTSSSCCGSWSSVNSRNSKNFQAFLSFASLSKVTSVQFMFRTSLLHLTSLRLVSRSLFSFWSAPTRGFASTICRMSDLSIGLTAPNGRKITLPTGIFINNKFLKSSSGEKITSINPT